MESYSGRTTRYLRKALGLKQREMAAQLGISVVHYCNIENGKAHPSPELLGRYRDIWDIDLHVLGWSLYGDVSRLPRPLQDAAAAIAKSWKRELRKKLMEQGQIAD
jgi:transcriptional regulator with XRE-family HTH domain